MIALTLITLIALIALITLIVLLITLITLITYIRMVASGKQVPSLASEVLYCTFLIISAHPVIPILYCACVSAFVYVNVSVCACERLLASACLCACVLDVHMTFLVPGHTPISFASAVTCLAYISVELKSKSDIFYPSDFCTRCAKSHFLGSRGHGKNRACTDSVIAFNNLKSDFPVKMDHFHFFNFICGSRIFFLHLSSPHLPPVFTYSSLTDPQSSIALVSLSILITLIIRVP
jgi:hypothetical protein